MRSWYPIFYAAFVLLLGGAANACGNASDCRLETGTYRYEAPDIIGSQLPVVVYFHGYGSSAENTIEVDRNLVNAALERGYVFLALNGMTRNFEGAKNGWSVRDGQHPLRNQADFARAAVQDLAGELSLDLSRVLLAGYSMGGSAVLDTACHSPQGFAGFVVLNGAMWTPLPKTCVEPVQLFQIHAFSDTVMPLEGLSYGPVSTGDVFAGLKLVREVAVDSHTPDGFAVSNEMSCRFWQDSAVRFCLYDGDHTWPTDWMQKALDWFEQRSGKP
ncbi:PHB depolymerase family esterase [uncultured Roseibium sp.]|uniref:alpha/beta hydrolase family esterase n=1 Tax=uncultured Roseibium sp. TaxID=1936171 RepID=UPI0026213C39|nr:PHB depolymerase family esterase [uncultured Roseibium sp.]